MSLARIDAVTVCVNYADYLQHVISNKECFDSWTIVTVEQDRETIAVCEANNIDYLFSDRVLMDGGFHKGKAINDAISVVDPQEWICLIDADTLLKPRAFNTIRPKLPVTPDHIIGIHGRFQVDSVAELSAALQREEIYASELEHVQMLVGFFQMWHSSRIKFYPEEYPHAGGDDVIMRESYSQNNWRFFPSYAIHLGPMFKNHKGRVTGKFK